MSPILRVFAHDPALEIFAHFPNTNFNTQKKQGNKPDRPDFKVMIERRKCPSVVADVGTVYRHFIKARGIMVLAGVGVFSVPTATIHMGALLASLPTLFWHQPSCNGYEP
ncbi:hypothetical protein BGZ88_003308 [Linnemannia elongata]|nr:hypothetical protein BGZ88_003308 [Linnemannia elongata]